MKSDIKLLFFAALFFPTVLLSQEKTSPSTSLTIKGEITSSKIISVKELSQYPEKEIGDVMITNHLGEKKSDQKSLKGVLLKDVLGVVEIKSESPKALSEFYIVCRASDGYKVVYSWNELFNSPAGDAVFIVTSKEGKRASEMEESILMISPRDFKTGRRFVKSVSSIEIYRAL
jgi:hypothetical protein